MVTERRGCGHREREREEAVLLEKIRLLFRKALEHKSARKNAVISTFLWRFWRCSSVDLRKSNPKPLAETFSVDRPWTH